MSYNIDKIFNANDLNSNIFNPNFYVHNNNPKKSKLLNLSISNPFIGTNKFDERLNVLKKTFGKNDITGLSKIFDKPVLDNEAIEDLNKKSELLEQIDFEEYIIQLIGDDNSESLKLMDDEFPELIIKRLKPAIDKINFYCKYAKTFIRGNITRNDLILKYLVDTDKIKIDFAILDYIMQGITTDNEDPELPKKFKIPKVPEMKFEKHRYLNNKRIRGYTGRSFYKQNILLPETSTLKFDPRIVNVDPSKVYNKDYYLADQSHIINNPFDINKAPKKSFVTQIFQNRL